MEAHLALLVVESRVQLLRPMDPAAIDDHDEVFAGFPEGGQHLMELWAQLLGINMRDDLIEHCGGPILDRTNNAAEHPPGDTAPGAITDPGVAFEGLLAVDLSLAQRA